ncbi:hypothetical protein Rhopal_001793-T1 [Rhodotorula paludigena]|uniref:Vps72/YL1 C-terminal domain-containing protein n=1 Tax=Rhodotorula paludigena TaxID=86838 RepID=A0AAV5GID5_9BASI|nr:hypothetical protein Rhopal_001793-T1 [Rhodotorula paludigena]
MTRRNSRAASTPAPDEPEDEESADETFEDDEPVEANLLTRTRRNNAGNRMAALIEDEATAEVEEMFKEEENDEEFEQKEEKDEFDSDFGSTDDEAGGDEDDEEAGERELKRQAKEDKKAARGKKKKGFQAPVHPFARQTKAARKAAAAGPVASTSATTLDDEGAPAKKRKKVAVDPEFLLPQRESSRRTAVESRRQVQERVKESEQRKAVAPKPVKKATVTLTQADLIAEALETEEHNRAALLAFYAAEEDRREAERVAGMRYEIIGPKLTFLSRVQDRVDKGKGREGEKLDKGRKRLIEVIGEAGKKGYKAGGLEANGDKAAAPAAAGDAPRTRTVRGAAATASASLNSLLNSRDSTPAPGLPTPSTPPESQEYARNWLVFDNFEGSRGEELEALFGDHVDWLKPPPIPLKGCRGGTCPFTGLPARYRDPRTGTPYANLAAFRMLNALVDAQTYVWSESLGAYTSVAGFGLMSEVEAAWSRRPGARAAVPRYAAAGPSSVAAGHHLAPSSNGPPPIFFHPNGLPPPPPPPPGRAKPRAPSSSSSAAAAAANPYKVEYAHAGGSGRGSRGRASLDQAAAEAQGQGGAQVVGASQAPQARSIPGQREGGAFGPLQPQPQRAVTVPGGAGGAGGALPPLPGQG